MSNEIKIPERIKREVRERLKKREQLFEQNIVCPKCNSKDLRIFVWSPVWAGSLRNVSCRDCGEFFNVFWSNEDEICFVVDSEVARGLV